MGDPGGGAVVNRIFGINHVELTEIIFFLIIHYSLRGTCLPVASDAQKPILSRREGNQREISRVVEGVSYYWSSVRRSDRHHPT